MHDAKRFDSSPRIRSATTRQHRLNVLPTNPQGGDPDCVVGRGRFPSWLHRPLPKGRNLAATHQVLRGNRLHTVCEEAKCPNLFECFSRKTATFLLLGHSCTRACGFCDIEFAKKPPAADPQEPAHIAESVRQLGLRHVVLTMVARDDLPDGGAAHIAQVIRAIRSTDTDITIETLTSDFSGVHSSWDIVLAERPNIFNYNLETVRSHTPRVRHRATYERTLEYLRYAKASGLPRFIKSGIMVGLGETVEEVQQSICDLHAAGCEIITIGQYLQPSRRKLKVQSFVTPDQFRDYEAYGHEIGVPHMYCGPFVRSSYNADLVIKRASNSDCHP